jgi:hypothetical protein
MVSSEVPGAPGVFRVVHADHADPASGPDHLDQLVQHHLRMLLAALVVGLVADRLNPAVHAGPVGGVGDHLHRVGFGEVDRGRSVPLGQREPVRSLVHHEDLRGAAEDGAVRGHQPDRPGAEDRHGVPGADAGELGAVVAGGEDVGQHGEVVLVLGAGGQLEEVEVSPRHAQVLGLPDGLARRHAQVHPRCSCGRCHRRC